MGKRSLAIYLGEISACALALGFLTDMVYSKLGISARAVAGQAAEIFPGSVEFTAAILLAVLIGYSVFKGFRKSEGCACNSAAARDESYANRPLFQKYRK
jgi:hypothetical protein